MRKIMILTTALVFVLLMTTVSFAAPSVQLENPNVKAVDSEGNSVEIVVEYISNAASAGAAFVTIEETDLAYNLVKATYPEIAPENVRMISLMDVYIKGDASLISFPITLTFEVNSVEPTTKAYVIHYEDENWVILDSESGDGTVSAEFQSLSPVSIFVDSSTLGSDTDETAPNTGDGLIYYAIFLGLAAVFSSVYLYKRRLN